MFWTNELQSHLASISKHAINQLLDIQLPQIHTIEVTQRQILYASNKKTSDIRKQDGWLPLKMYVDTEFIYNMQMAKAFSS